MSPLSGDNLIDPKILCQTLSLPDHGDVEMMPTAAHDRIEPITDDFAQEAICNVSNASASARDEVVGSRLFLDEKFGSIKGNMCDEKALRLSHRPYGALLHQSEDMMGIVEASANDRPPAVDPEDHQYKVEKLIRKRRKGRKVHY